MPGQLERCAENCFRLVHEEDGTEDYRLTSEACLDGVRARLHSWALLRIAWSALPCLLGRPLHTARLLLCLLGSESWNWQFRGDPAPTVLLRQTWERLPGK